MSTSVTSRPRPASRTRLLGLRQPGRLAIAVFRLPLRLYRRGSGWLLGHTFLMLVHAGRRSGALHETTAMVLSFDKTTKEAIIFSAWGADADWIRNIRARPGVRVQVARDSFVPEQRFLTTEEAVAVVTEFRRRHPWRVRVATRLLGWGDLRSETAIREFVRTRPFVAFRPSSPAQAKFRG